MCFESQIRSIQAFLCGSSLEALAYAFLFFDHRKGQLGFHLVKALGEKSCNDYCPRLQSELRESCKSMVQRKDENGRTFLHYIILFRQKNETPLDYDLDSTDKTLEDSKMEIARLEERNRGHVVEACVLCMEPSAAFVQDSEGMNPFHFAISKGKQWDDGLEDLAKLVPDWLHSREGSTGLSPFMLAAIPSISTDDDVSTIYGLLRFDGSILRNIPDE